MTVAHDAQTRFPVTNGTDNITGDRTFTHTPSGTPKGVVVTLFNGGSTSAPVTGVLYGDAAMALSATATDATEAGRVDVYTLGVDVASGAQTVTLQGCTADVKWAMCSTVTAATNATQVEDTTVLNTQSSTNPQVTMTTAAATLTYGGVHSGLAAPVTTVLTGCTHQEDQDYGAKCAMAVRRTSQDAAGSPVIGYTAATDDWCMAAVALAEFDAPVAKTLAEAGSAGDALTVAAAATLAQAGSGADALSVDTGVTRTAPSFTALRGTAAAASTNRVTTGTFTPTAGSVLIATAWGDGGASTANFAAISDSLGGSWTGPFVIANITNGNEPGYIEKWYQVVGGSPASMIVSFDNNQDTFQHGGWVEEWASVDTAAPIGATNRASLSGGADPISAALTTQFPNSWVVGGAFNWNAATWAAGNANTVIIASQSVAGNAAGVTLRNTTATAAASTSVTLAVNRDPTVSNWHVVVAELKGAPETGDQSKTLTDTGSAADLAVVAATAAVADTATAADTAITVAAVALPDSGTGADTVTVDQGATPRTLTDTGSAADLAQIVAAAALLDSGTAADTVTVPASGTKTLTDTAAAADTVRVDLALPLADAAAAADLVTVAQAHTLADAAAAADTVTVAQAAAKLLADTAAAADTAATTAVVVLTDPATAADELLAAAAAILTDTAVAADTLVGVAAPLYVPARSRVAVTTATTGGVRVERHHQGAVAVERAATSGVLID